MRKMRELVRVGIVGLRFLLHPVDFLHLYEREAALANSAHAYTLERMRNDLRDVVTRFDAEIESLRQRLPDA